MLQKLETIREKYNALIASLSDSSIVSDPSRLKKIAKERAEIEPLVKKYNSLLKILSNLKESKDILDDPDMDEEMKGLAAEDEARFQEEAHKLEEELKVMLLPKDPRDAKDVLLEVRAGAGGDEASLFAQDLFRMYTRLAERKGWRFEIMNTSLSPIGGFKEVIVNIRGADVYSRLKYESGVHRVQRVPQTETSGRIHTSTVTVAVIPEADEVDIMLDPKDLKIEAFGASGPGGQNVNRNYTAIRVTHKVSGLVVSCQDEKSQHRNKEKALRILRSRLLDKAQHEQQEKISKDRRLQVGTGERSEKIRTYNFPQSRVTDHRLHLSLHKLESILDGEVDDIIEALRVHYQSEMMTRMETSSA